MKMKKNKYLASIKMNFSLFQAAMESYPGPKEDLLFKLVHDGAGANTVGLPLNVQGTIHTLRKHF